MWHFFGRERSSSLDHLVTTLFAGQPGYTGSKKNPKLISKTNWNKKCKLLALYFLGQQASAATKYISVTMFASKETSDMSTSDVLTSAEGNPESLNCWQSAALLQCSRRVLYCYSAVAVGTDAVQWQSALLQYSSWVHYYSTVVECTVTVQ